MQAALMLRSKSRVARRRKLRKLGGRLELPSNVATKEIAPFPRYPPESWCAQGRAAWLERGRRCSVQDSQQQATCHRRWVKRNRIQDASLGGSSDDEDFLGVLRGPSTFANAFLYVGLGTIALGLVIAFVGTGEKGFKTVELRLIGPSLIGLGLICCILRILFCICPSHCISSSSKARKKKGNKVDADHTTSLLRGESKRVAISRGPSMQPKYPITHKRSNSKMLNEGMEALRQIATTSLFMQNEQKPSMNRVVPIIREPENPAEAPLEMKKLETALNVCEMSDEEIDNDEIKTGKLVNDKEAMKTADLTATTTTSTIKTTGLVTSTAATTTTNIQQTCANTEKHSTATTINDRPLSSSGKLARQRVALNQQQQEDQTQPLTEPTPLSGTVRRCSPDISPTLMETSLMVVQPTALIAEARPPNFSSSGTVSGNANNALDATKLLFKMAATTTTTTTFATSIPPPPTYTGAISRLQAATTIATSTTAPTLSNISTSGSGSGSGTAYDIPPATPHSYAAFTRSTSGSERESLIRGPLGMPLSALTASTSNYTLPPPAPSTNSVSTTNAVSLLPLPTPPPPITATATVTTATSTTLTSSALLNNQPCIPGQVLEITSTTPSRPSSATGVQLSSPRGFATTSLSILRPHSSGTMALTPTTAVTAPTVTTSAPANGNASYKFPLLLSGTVAGTSIVTSNISSSTINPATINGRTVAPTTIASAVTVGGATLAPPLTVPPSSKLEPELLLSPAKLGQ